MRVWVEKVVSMRIIIIDRLFRNREMSSYKATTEDSSTDRPDMFNKLFHLKMYTFFVFYQPTHLQLATSLQVCLALCRSSVLSWKMRRRRCRWGRVGRRVASWCRLTSTTSRVSRRELRDSSTWRSGDWKVRRVLSAAKSKIVSYCSEQGLIHLIERAAVMGLDLSNIPVILAQSHPNSDFSSFCGTSGTN